MFHVTITQDDESLNRIYGPRHCFRHPTDGRIQLSPVPEPIATYEEALSAYYVASDYMDDAIRAGDLTNSTVTMRGPLGLFRSHSFAKARGTLSLAKPAHPNLLTNA